MVVLVQFSVKNARLLILDPRSVVWELDRTEEDQGPGGQLREMAQLCQGRIVTAFQPSRTAKSLHPQTVPTAWAKKGVQNGRVCAPRHCPSPAIVPWVDIPFHQLRVHMNHQKQNPGHQGRDLPPWPCFRWSSLRTRGDWDGCFSVHVLCGICRMGAGWEDMCFGQDLPSRIWSEQFSSFPS